MKKLLFLALLSLFPVNAFAGTASAISDTNIKLFFFQGPTIDNQIKRWRVNPGPGSGYGLQAHFSTGKIPPGEPPAIFGMVPPEIVLPAPAPAPVSDNVFFPFLPPIAPPLGDTKFNLAGPVPVGKIWGPLARPASLLCGAVPCGSSSAGGNSFQFPPAGVWGANTFARVDVPIPGFHGYGKVFDPWEFSDFEPDGWIPSASGTNFLSFASLFNFTLEASTSELDISSSSTSFTALVGDELFYHLALSLNKSANDNPIFSYLLEMHSDAYLLDNNGNILSSSPQSIIESYLQAIPQASSISGSLEFNLGFGLPAEPSGYPLPTTVEFRHDAVASLEEVPAPLPILGVAIVFRSARRLRKHSRQLRRVSNN
jgi:hypothetical protein